MGQVGKEKNRAFRVLSYRVVLVTFLPLVAAQIVSCSLNPTRTYTGMLMPRAGACDESARAILLRKNTRIQFVPKDGVIVLEGTLSGTEFTASRQLTDMDHVRYVLRFTGQLRGDHITGAYVTPRCRYDIDLAPSPG
jgi:hypothetical protein